MNTPELRYRATIPLVVGILLSLVFFRLVWGWTNPTQSPPNGNVSLPSAQWTASGTAIYNSNSGNVGIGITGPGQKLSVAGTIESTSGGFKFPDGTVQTKSARTPSVQTFTSSGTWTKPSGVTKVVVEVIGGGGGGAEGNAGAGGGGGGTAIKTIDVSGISSETVTIGAGGSAGGTGGAGGTSSFGTHASSTGGGGGAIGGAGGNGGTGASGSINIAGGKGRRGTGNTLGGAGGSSTRGFGGPGGGATAGDGIGGDGYGAGGGGGASNVNVGAAGTSGVVIVWEY